METLYVKIISSCVIFIVTLLGGFLPFTIIRKWISGNSSENDKLCLLRSVAGGIFLGACLLHLLPEAREAMESAFGKTRYPVTEACIGIGFLIMFITENLMLACKPVPVPEFSVSFTKQESTDSGFHPNTIGRYGSVDDSECNRKKDMDLSVDDQVLLKEDKTLSPSQTPDMSSFRSYVLLIALSLHTVFDGLVIGIQDSASLVWQLLVAMSIHKALVAFSLGLSFVDSHTSKPRAAKLYLVFFALVAPIGAGIGTALTESDVAEESRLYVTGFLQCLATGTFMFVTFCECLKDELLGQKYTLKILMVLLGFSIVAGLRFAISD